MKKIQYELNYTYYQYNSGAADNGTYKKTLTYNEDDYKLVLKQYEDIQKSIINSKNNAQNISEQEEDLKNSLIPYMGYFTDVNLSKKISETINLEDGKAYVNTDFSECEFCYCEEERYSIGCQHCEGTGFKQLTPQNIELATKAHEWLEEKMNSLWSDYNEIFKLNRGLGKWTMGQKVIYMVGTYNCRGYEYNEDYELPIEWLYDKNRRELMEDVYKKEGSKTPY